MDPPAPGAELGDAEIVTMSCPGSYELLGGEYPQVYDNQKITLLSAFRDQSSASASLKNYVWVVRNDTSNEKVGRFVTVCGGMVLPGEEWVSEIY